MGGQILLSVKVQDKSLKQNTTRSRMSQLPHSALHEQSLPSGQAP